MKFVIVGGKGDLLPQAQALQSLDPRRVYIACDIPFAELALYYAAADVVVTPTTDERACMGLAIKEAMATGKPVIATRVGGVPEAVVDGETGVLIEPENPRELAESIADLLGNPQRMRAMGIEGRQRALGMFNTELTNQRMMHIFQEVIEN